MVFVAAFASCDPCDDCTATAYEPTIELVFINADSLSQLNDSTDIVTASSTALTSSIAELSDTLTFLVDSLQNIEDSIANGGSLDAAKTSIENAITTFTEDRDTQTTERTELDSLNTVMNEIKTVINSGLLLVDEIQVIETGGSLTFEDSTTSYQVPLSYDQSFNGYSVTIGAEINTFEVDYATFQELDERRNVLIRASDIMITTHSFDSVDVCEENCFDKNATYTFYF